MSTSMKRTRAIIEASSTPKLPKHIKLRHDAGRGRWLILAPERVFEPDDISVEILKQCDGAKTVGAIAEALSRDYNAPMAEILADTISMIQELADKGVVTA